MVRLHRPSLSSLSPPLCPSPPIPMATTDPRTELPCIPLVLSPSPAALLLSATHARTRTHTPYPSSLLLPMPFSFSFRRMDLLPRLFRSYTPGLSSLFLAAAYSPTHQYLLSIARILFLSPVAVPCLLLLFLVGPPVGSNFYSERAIRNGPPRRRNRPH